MSTRDIGKKLEDYVLEVLKVTDDKCKPTNNSGAVSDNGDIQHRDYVVECKKRNTENVTIPRKVWIKLCNQIRLGTQKTALLVVENKHGEKWAVLSLKDFGRIIKEKYYAEN